MTDQLIGQVIDGYRIQEVLGQGGMGTVYKGEDVNLSRPVALKRINPGQQNREMFIHRFRSEAKALARIDSTYIVGVYALRETDVGLLIVMEYVDGGTLKDKMQEHGVMPPDVALPYLKQMLRAFGDAHRAGVIHRDIKPQNILLSSNDEVKITDFGIAKLRTPDSGETVTQGGQGGTLKYMSPEQVASIDEVDDRSDLYSIGMTAYEMVAGTLPFEETETDFDIMRKVVEGKIPSPDEYNPDLPKSLVAWIRKATAKEQGDRYQTADAMLKALRDIEEDVLASGAESWDEESDTETVLAGEDETVFAMPEDDADDTASPDADSQDTSSQDTASQDTASQDPTPQDTASGDVASGGGEEAGGGTVLAAEEEDRTQPATPSASATSSSGPKTDRAPESSSASGESDGPNWAAIGGGLVGLLLFVGAGAWMLMGSGGAASTGGGATLSAATNPSSATVYVDGDSVGQTPLAGVTLPAGTVPLRIVKDGYQPAETTLTVPSGGAVRLDAVTLEPKPARLTVTSSPDAAQVVADGEVLGQTPLDDARLPRTGDVELQLRKDGYETVAQTFSVGPGESVTWTPGALRRAATAQSAPQTSSQPASSQPTTAQSSPSQSQEPATSDAAAAMGNLNLTGVTSGATLTVGDVTRRSAGVTQVPAGTHEVTCSHPNYPDASPIRTTITVDAGSTRDLGCYFEQKVVVNSVGTWGNVWVNGSNTGERTQHTFDLGPGTYEISLPIPRSETLNATGGRYQKRSESGETSRSTFSGDTFSITIQPTFVPETHAIVFQTTGS